MTGETRKKEVFRILRRWVPRSDGTTNAPSYEIEAVLHPFDRLHHTDTSGFMCGSDLATGHHRDADNTAYYGMAPSRFEAMLDRWQRGAGRSLEEYTFLDLGCGKGRALLLAARRPFCRVIGIELHAGLAKIAKRNARLWKNKGYALAPIRIACEDATTVRLPDGPCLLYLFHPFEAPAMTSLIHNLYDQLTRRNVTLDMLYFNPDAGAVIEAQTGFQLQWSASLPLSEEEREGDPLVKEGDLCNLYRWVGDDKEGIQRSAWLRWFTQGANLQRYRSFCDKEMH